MNEPGDAAVTNAELFGDEDTASHATQIVDVRTSLHIRRLRLVVQTGPAAGREFATDEEIVVDPDKDGSFGEMVGRSLKMRQIFGLLKKIAPMDVSVLITGETGTGKELVARGLHDNSPRGKAAFVVLDCGSIPENLI